jgi:hypothetical protein
MSRLKRLCVQRARTSARNTQQNAAKPLTMPVSERAQAHSQGGLMHASAHSSVHVCKRVAQHVHTAQHADCDDIDPFWVGVKMPEKSGIVYNADCQKIALWEREITVEEELRRLVFMVANYENFTKEDYKEALQVALADQGNALTCFRSLAKQSGLI